MEISTILWILCGIFNACVIFKRVKLDNAINVLLAAMGICMGPFVTLLILISFWASHSSAVEGAYNCAYIHSHSKAFSRVVNS